MTKPLTRAQIALALRYHLYGKKFAWHDDCEINGVEVNPLDFRALVREDDECAVYGYGTFTVDRDAYEKQVVWSSGQSRFRDNQKSKCYAWEARHMWRTTDRLTTEGAASLVSRIFADYGLPGRVPAVQVSAELTRKSYYQCMGNYIRLAYGWGLAPDVVIHEAAHGLMAQGYAEYKEGGSRPRQIPVEAHGPEFVNLLCELYAIYLPSGRWNHDEALLDTKIRRDKGFCLASHVHRTQKDSFAYRVYSGGVETVYAN